MINQNKDNELTEGEDFILPQKAINALQKTPLKTRLLL
jgi:hypothetical protein